MMWNTNEFCLIKSVGDDSYSSRNCTDYFCLYILLAQVDDDDDLVDSLSIVRCSIAQFVNDVPVYDDHDEE